MDAISHHSGMDDDESNVDALRQVTAGEAAGAGGGVPAADDGEGAADSDDSDVEADLRRLFRM